MAHQLHEGIDRFRRSAKTRDLVGCKFLARLSTGCIPEPCGKHWFEGSAVLAPLFDEPDDRLCNGRARRQRSRAIHHEYGVRLIGAKQDLHGVQVALGVGITDDIDRIAVRPCGRQNSVERPKRGFGKLGQVAIQISKPIGRQDAGATAIGENGKAVAVEPRLARKDLRSAEKLVELAYTQHACASERRFIGGIGAGQRARVRLRRLGPRRAAAGLDDNHRLRPSGAACGRHELRRVGDRLHVQQDGATLRIARQVVEQIAKIRVSHIAERDDVRKADVAPARPIDDARDQGSRLREQGDVAGQRRKREAGIQADAREHETNAVRPLNAKGVWAGRIEHRLFQLAADTSGDDDCGARSFFSEFARSGPGTVGGGVTRTARSGARGNAATEG